VFPECTTTNGKGILRLSPSVVAAPRGTRIFPISLRYTPADVATPVPGSYLRFLWSLLSKPTHFIRVRVADAIVVDTSSDRETDADQMLDRVGEGLARLGRVKRVGLGVDEKRQFVMMWSKRR
jgi:hypothetical protein